MTLQFRRWNRTTPIVVSIPERLDSGNLTEYTLMNHLHGLDIAWVEQTLLTGEEDVVHFLMLVVHRQALVHCESDCLFAKYLLASFAGINKNLIVRIQRSNNQNGIDGLVIQQLAVVAIDFCLWSNFQSFVNGWLINVTDGCHLGFRILCKKTHVQTTARARAYNT